MISDKDNMVNIYANKTSRNYFYNSRFSFLCGQGNKYSFDEMKKDLEKIEQIQDETSVYNYHPYKKAFIYLNNLIQTEINEKKSVEILRPQLSYLEYCFNKYKETLKWCKKHQPYILQLRFDFSTVDYPDKGIKVFYPSSMLRPLNFNLLNDTVVDFQNKLSLLKYSVDNQHYYLELLEARNQIENIEKDTFKLLSFFSTIIIFLVGTITIFTGNSSNVTIFSKVEYVAVLGVILLLFVCVGYIAMSYKENGVKKLIFGFLTGILLMILVNLFTRMPDNKGEINVQDDSPIETTSNKKDFVKPSLNPSSIK